MGFTDRLRLSRVMYPRAPSLASPFTLLLASVLAIWRSPLPRVARVLLLRLLPARLASIPMLETVRVVVQALGDGGGDGFPVVVDIFDPDPKATPINRV